MPAYPDEQLVMKALGDSHLAFEQLVKQYQYKGDIDSPDRQRIAYSKRSEGHRQSELWVMENLLTTFAADK